MTNSKPSASKFFPISLRGRLTHSQAAPFLIVFAAGMNLIFIQWILIRELTALLFGTELVVLLVTVTYFWGLSIGYKFASTIPRSWLIALGTTTLILHLTLPVWFRLIVVGLKGAEAFAVAYILLPILTPFVVSAFYSMFLPRFVDGGNGQLPKFYALELLGAACGIVLLVILGSLGLQILLAVYSLTALIILFALNLPKRWAIAFVIGSAFWVAVFPYANYLSNTAFFTALKGLPPGTETVFSSYSPYQKVDVLRTMDNRRYLYLDGLEHFGSDDSSRLNIMMGEIPAKLIQPENALVIGAGSMHMARLIARHAGYVTTVEIDPLVVQASLEYFDDYNLMSSLSNRRIVIDDAKHFIANSIEQYGMISTDTPAAFTIQTATLYSLPFYQAIAGRLTPGGVLVANLNEDFTLENNVSRRIAASLLNTFNEVMIVTSESAGWSFAYAADRLPFTRDELSIALRTAGESQFIIFESSAAKAIVGNAQPITLDSMDVVFHVSLERIINRLNRK